MSPPQHTPKQRVSPSEMNGFYDHWTSYRCGCFSDEDGIDLCPTHAAAPEMLAYVKHIADGALGLLPHDPCGGCKHRDCEEVRRARALLQRTEVGVSTCPIHPHATDEASARLIAAAPEMLASLRMLLSSKMSGHVDGNEIKIHVDQAYLVVTRALLARIEGREL